MAHKMFRTVFVTLAFVLLFSAAAFAQRIDCTKRTDAEIVSSVYQNIKVKSSSEMAHVNVTSNNGVVTIRGYATTKSAKKAIENAAKKTACVKRVVSHLTVGSSGGCGPGQKPCGEICIPIDETCTIQGPVT